MYDRHWAVEEERKRGATQWIRMERETQRRPGERIHDDIHGRMILGKRSLWTDTIVERHFLFKHSIEKKFVLRFLMFFQ